MGVHLWLLATANGSFDISLLLICIGTMAIGMLAGMLFFIVPSGAGARDVLVALALTPAVGVTAAAAFAVASRVMFTVAELGTAGISAGSSLPRLRTDRERAAVATRHNPVVPQGNVSRSVRVQRSRDGHR